MTEEQARAALAVEFDCHDLGTRVTVGAYLRTLLVQLWRDGEGFSGKRPFGNSGWEWDVYVALAGAGLIPGVWDERTQEWDVEREDAEPFVVELIGFLTGPGESGPGEPGQNDA